ncbi:extracellular solute-binding protein, family 3 [Marinobacter sp. LV10R510-11A]|nr:extracellular solute-binding protein, family 3 [Marinobacter sp. LV10R510-11A]
MRYAHCSLPYGRERGGMLANTALCLGLLFASLWGGAAQANTNGSVKDYVLWYRNYDSPAIYALVNLALNKTPEYGEFRILRSSELSQGRALLELAQGDHRLLDIANVATTSNRELFLMPIPIPVDGGLLGFRVCVVTPKSLPEFKGIHSLADLRDKGISIGQGTHWPDTSILRENGIPVITHTRYEILFGMLRKDRFDCFARGVSEVLNDLEIENDPNLVIEPGLLLAYPMPSYLFVARDDQPTAHRLELGMERAIRDGSFGEFLKQYYGAAIEALDLDKRTMIILTNPFLSEESENIGRHTLDNLRRRLELLNR